MAKALAVTANTCLLLPVRNTELEAVALCATSDSAVMEVFDGTFGTIATIALNAGGTGYTAGDVLTLQQKASGVQATVRVDTIGALGAITAVTLLTGGTGYAAGQTLTVTGGTGGDDATIDVNTISDAGVLTAKIAAVANESAPPEYLCALTTQGISVRITGTNAKGHVYYE